GRRARRGQRRIPPPPLRRAPRPPAARGCLVSAWPLGQVTVMGACILDVLGRPVETIPPGQGSVRLAEIRATAAGTAAGPAIDLEHITGSRALLIGAPDALAGLTGQELADVAKAASSQGALVVVDVLHPGRPQDLERLAPLLGQADWFLPNADQLLALTGRASLAGAMDDIVAQGTRGVAVTLGADGCLVATRQDPAAMT